jgi:predicted RNA-binding Zn-ribbon protein involved in translation (DUF1610 family)
MRAGRIISFIAAGIFILLSFLFILGSLQQNNFHSGWLIIGIIGMLIGFGLIFLGTKLSPPIKAGDQNVTLNIDLPGNVKMETIKCRSCGAPLAPEDIKMVAGAPVVSCPNCGTTYQITEEPKW